MLYCFLLSLGLIIVTRKEVEGRILNQSQLPNEIFVTAKDIRENAFGSASLAAYWKNTHLCMGILVDESTVLTSPGYCSETGGGTLSHVHLLALHMVSTKTPRLHSGSYKVKKLNGVENFMYMKIDSLNPDSVAVPISLPLKSEPPPPPGTECYTFDFNLHEKPSRKWQDLTISRRPVSIIEKNNCQMGDFDGKVSTFCSKISPVVKANNCQNDRPAFMICKQWWNSTSQSNGTDSAKIVENAANVNATHPHPNAVPEEPKDVSLVCLFYPNRPWCPPNGGNSVQRGILQIPTTQTSKDWYMAGVVKEKGVNCFDTSTSAAYYYTPTVYNYTFQ